MKKTNLKLKADRIFSKFVRLSHANSAGFCICYTCQKRFHWKAIHAGHYIRRSVLATRFDLMNVKPQCVVCNTFNEGMRDKFALNLIFEYGMGVLEELDAIGRRLYATRSEREALFREIIEYYEPRVKEMERGKN